ncbi:WxL domain-containing protein [Carnobacterium gallinarum]|uniref:WxL domain-containing protein n=1 Tax=Carnobacterium gallinarum TaxID=2749 RepID=UPI0005594A0F|nr:WxL domain-containing protein [Carnobacterium gallinarum]
MSLKQFTKISLISTVSALMLFSAALPVLAAVEESVPTKGDIGFEKDETGTTPPLESENPDIDEPVDLVEPPVSTVGALRIDVAPILHFGNNNKIVATRQNYYAEFVRGTKFGETVVSDIANYLQVTDVRGGTQGFKVSVKTDGIFTSGTDKIENTIITMNDFSIHSGSKIVDSTVFPKVSTTPMSISDNQSHVLMDAAVGQGYGIWTMPMGTEAVKTSGQGKDGTGTTGAIDVTKAGRNPAIQLTIPAGQIIKASTATPYVSTLNWTISDNI